MKRLAYPSDLSDRATARALVATAQTGRPTHHLPPSGDRQRHPLRAAHWLLLADAAPRWRIVPLRTWRRDGASTGTWSCTPSARLEGRQASPSASSVSVKTTEKGGSRGYDAGKKVKGRKSPHPWWIPWGPCRWRWQYIPPTFRTGTAPGWCWPGCWAVSLERTADLG